MLRTLDDALALLARLGAPAHLLRHHALVAEAAAQLTAGLSAYSPSFDAEEVLLGAALHDAGKIQHPAEMRGPGALHEEAGRALLEAEGYRCIARFCVSHGQWDDDALPLEDLLVALADKLWKGKRVAELEERVVASIAGHAGEPQWQVLTRVDPVFESVADLADGRLARSQT